MFDFDIATSGYTMICDDRHIYKEALFDNEAYFNDDAVVIHLYGYQLKKSISFPKFDKIYFEQIAEYINNAKQFNYMFHAFALYIFCNDWIDNSRYKCTFYVNAKTHENIHIETRLVNNKTVSAEIRIQPDLIFRELKSILDAIGYAHS